MSSSDYGPVCRVTKQSRLSPLRTTLLTTIHQYFNELPKYTKFFFEMQVLFLFFFICFSYILFVYLKQLFDAPSTARQITGVSRKRAFKVYSR